MTEAVNNTQRNNYKPDDAADVLIVGGGPAGLAAAIQLKTERPEAEICVIEKAAHLGNHNLSGAVLEPEALHHLLDTALPDWQNSTDANEVLSKKVVKDNIMFFAGKNIAVPLLPVIKIAAKLHLGFGRMLHENDYIVSISKLTAWLGKIAGDLGVEVLTGFGAEDIILSEGSQSAAAIKLVDQGVSQDGSRQPNFVPGEIIEARFIILAEGCDGLVTEKFVQKANLERRAPQLYSIAVKELIKVSPQQYKKFGTSRVLHAMGYPLWSPVIGPGIFGGGIMYPEADNHLAVGIIAGADFKYRDFNPQDALTNFKNHRFVKKFIRDGTIVEAGAKMIPEAGYYAVPRARQTGSIGQANTLLVGDGAGFVNMLKIKGLHNAIESGIKAANAVSRAWKNPSAAAQSYTGLLENSNLIKEMRIARNFRQTIAKFGQLLGFPLSSLGRLLPIFRIEPDYQVMSVKDYRHKPTVEYDKDTFTAMASTQHREEQPCHLTIVNTDICSRECTTKFHRPCITFCPGGVYETVHDTVKPANPSNCLHCKTCQRKCPFDNIRWTCPEGGGGPRYKQM